MKNPWDNDPIIEPAADGGLGGMVSGAGLTQDIEFAPPLSVTPPADLGLPEIEPPPPPPAETSWWDIPALVGRRTMENLGSTAHTALAQLPGGLDKGYEALGQGMHEALDPILGTWAAKADDKLRQPQAAEQPLTWQEFLWNPEEAGKKILYTAGLGAPLVAGYAAGVPGMVATTVMMELGPQYEAALAENPDDPDAAFDTAWKRTAISGAATGAGGALLSSAPFKGVAKNFMFQTFAVQPALGIFNRAGQEAVVGKKWDPSTAADAILQDVSAGLPLTAVDAAVSGAGRVAKAVKKPWADDPIIEPAAPSYRDEVAADDIGVAGLAPQVEEIATAQPELVQTRPQVEANPPTPPDEIATGKPETRPPLKQFASFEAEKEYFRQRDARADALGKDLEAGKRVEGVDGSGNRLVATKSFDQDQAPWRVTMFDGDEPTGHIEYDTAKEAARHIVNAQPREKPSPPAPKSDADLAGVSFFRPKELAVDAKTFQFKSGGDEFGVSERLANVTKWDPRMAGQIMVWERLDGQKFVNDGHQRVGLAKRIQAKDPSQDIVLAGQLLREADGFTAEDAMVVAANKNMAEGTGTPTDAAKVLRLRPETLNDPSMPLNGRNMRIARDLVPLKADAFGMVINEVVPEEHAAIVGRLIPDDGPMQVSVLGLLNDLEPGNLTEAESIVRQAIESGSSRETQVDMFGETQVAESYFGERAKILSKTLAKLGRDKRVFGTLVNEADTITSAGNKLDTNANERAAQMANTARAVLLKAANKKGPLSDALTAAAKRARDSGRFEGAVNEFAAEVRRAAESGALIGDTVGAPKRGFAEDWDQYLHPVTAEPLSSARARALERPQTIAIQTPERDALRVSIAQELYGDGAKIKNREAVIVLGPPASGKSTFLDKYVKDGSALLIDSDEAKKRLPEFDDGYGSTAVHEESDVIVSGMVLPMAIRNGDNIALPLVGRSGDKIASLASELRSHGYTVKVVMVDVPVAVAAKRAAKRYAKEGRLVDPDYVLSVGDKPKQTLRKLIDENLVNEAIHYDNNVEFGAPPTLIERYTVGESGRLERVADQGDGDEAAGDRGLRERNGRSDDRSDLGRRVDAFTERVSARRQERFASEARPAPVRKASTRDLTEERAQYNGERLAQDHEAWLAGLAREKLTDRAQGDLPGMKAPRTKADVFNWAAERINAARRQADDLRIDFNDIVEAADAAPGSKVPMLPTGDKNAKAARRQAMVRLIGQMRQTANAVNARGLNYRDVLWEADMHPSAQDARPEIMFSAKGKKPDDKQMSLLGTEEISQKELAQRAMDARKLAKKAQNLSVEELPLFGEKGKQETLFSAMSVRRTNEPEPPELIALHNLSASKLLHAHKMGGLAAPSLAVIKAKHGMSTFGEISLLGDKGLIDPKAGAKVFGADVYSPRYPTVNTKVKRADVERIWKSLKQESDDLGNVLSSELDGEQIAKDGLNAFENSSAVMLKFAREHGLNPEIPMKKGYRDGDPDRPDTYEFKTKFRKEIKDDRWLPWLEDTYGKYLTDQVIALGYNSAGRWRTIAHTLGNAVKIMTKKVRDGEGFNYGVGSIRSLVAPKFSSLAAVRREKGRIIDRPSFEALKKEADDAFLELANGLQHKSNTHSDPRRSFGFMDALSEHLKEIAQRGNVKRVLDEYYRDIDTDDVKMVGDFMQRLRDMPTEYFEAKLPRAVSLSEFKAAIVPDDVPKAVLDVLRDNGITDVRSYKRGDEADRARAIDEANEHKFSAPAAPFYSAVERAIKAAPMQRAKGSQWLGMLKNKPGIKADELDTVGLTEMLTDRADDMVTKAELTEHVKDNAVVLEETRLGDGASKFQDYKLPGGKNYREVLMRLPEGNLGENLALRRWAIENPFVTRNIRSVEDVEVARRHNTFFREASKDIPAQKVFDQIRRVERGDIKPEKKVYYKKEHWSQPNVLAHLRLADREDSDGAKVLHVEEVQSDWHQDGRDRGYATKDSAAKADELELQRKALFAVSDAISEKLTQRDMRIAFDLSDGKALNKREILDLGSRDLLKKYHDAFVSDETMNRLRNEQYANTNKIHELNKKITALRGGVPDAPFKKTWHELAMKRALREAAEGDYEKIAWTPGDEHSARYALSRHVDELFYSPSEKHFEARKNGREVATKFGIEPSGLAEYVGKEVAAKLLEQPQVRRNPQAPFLYHTLKGDDLKVGGHGMVGFYDKILVDWANKWAKKYGKRVNKTLIDTGKFTVFRDDADMPYRVQSKTSPNVIARFKTADEAWAEAVRLGSVALHSIEITPEMRADLMQGQTLFKTRSKEQAASKDWDLIEQAGPHDADTMVAYKNLSDKDRAKHAALIKSVDDVLAKLTPASKVEWNERVSYIIDGREHGAYGSHKLNRRQRTSLISLALDSGTDVPLEVTARHEAIHALRGLGYLTPKEWRTLVDESKAKGWLDEHNIESRYGRLSDDIKHEEAIADAFSLWRRDRGLKLPAPIRQIFRRIDNAMRKIAASVRRVMGKDATADDIMLAIELGEVGRRSPSASDVARSRNAASLMSKEDNGPPEDVRAEKMTVSGLAKVLFGSWKNPPLEKRAPVNDLKFEIKRKIDSYFPSYTIQVMDGKKPIAEIEARYFVTGKGTQFKQDKPQSRMIYIDWIGQSSDMTQQAFKYANALGPAEVRKIYRQLKELFPAADAIAGYRVSGARGVKNSADAKTVVRPDMAKITQSLPFKEWFKGSKVVDDQGKPRVVYHGTDTDFTAFNPHREFSDRHTGIWFASDPRTAESYATRFGTKSEGAQILPTYLRMENPRVFKEHVERPDLVVKQAGLDGYDGVIFERPSKRYNEAPWYIVFEPTQVKSAIGNVGSYMDSAADIRFSAMRQTPSPAARAAHVQSTMDKIRVKVEDKFLPLRRVQEAIARARGKPIDADADAYVAEAIYHGRSGERIERFNDRVVDPLLAKMVKMKVSAEDLHNFLYARHAFERNAEIAKIDPTGSQPNLLQRSKGSGMSDKEAQAILDGFAKKGMTKPLESLAADIDAIQQTTRDILERGDLLSPDMRRAWEAKYEHYVPLKGFEDSIDPTGADVTERARIGRGFDIRGQESKRALGRSSRAGDILAHVLAAHEEAIVRAEKNRVSRTFLTLVEDNPDPGLWEVDKVPLVRDLNKTTGLVGYRQDHRHKLADNVMGVKVGGDIHYITIHDPALAQAMRNLNATDMGPFINAIGTVNRYLSKTVTQWNPAFTIPNLARDVQSALVNVKSMSDKAKVTDILRDIPAAMKGAFQASRGKNKTEWQKWANEMAEEGGKISFFGMDDIETRAKAIRDKIERLKPGVGNAALTAVTEVGNLFSDLNGAVENATRVSTYANLRRAGVPKKEAANIARNVTVNFNRKGELGPYLNAAFLFFNASVQGSMTMMRSLKAMGPKAAAAVIGGGIMFGAMQDLINSAMAPEDEDGDSRWDKVSDWTKDHNWMVMNPVEGSNAVALKIPAPYGFNVLAAIGRRIAELARGKEGVTAIKAAAGVIGVAMNSFNPIGGDIDLTDAKSIARAATPTILSPVTEVAVNQNFAGRPIQKPEENFGQPIPQSERGFRTTNPILKDVTAWLNSATGGSRVRPGVIDVSPAVIQHYMDFITGGVGQTVSKSLALPFAGADGDNPKTWPVIGRFVEGVNEGWTSRRYFDLSKAIDITANELKAALKDGDKALAARTRRDYAPEVRVMGVFKSVDGQVRKLFAQRNALATRLTDDATARDEKIAALDAQIEKLQARAVAAYNNALRGTKPLPIPDSVWHTGSQVESGAPPP